MTSRLARTRSPTLYRREVGSWVPAATLSAATRAAAPATRSQPSPPTEGSEMAFCTSLLLSRLLPMTRLGRRRGPVDAAAAAASAAADPDPESSPRDGRAPNCLSESHWSMLRRRSEPPSPEASLSSAGDGDLDPDGMAGPRPCQPAWGDARWRRRRSLPTCLLLCPACVRVGGVRGGGAMGIGNGMYTFWRSGSGPPEVPEATIAGHRGY